MFRFLVSVLEVVAMSRFIMFQTASCIICGTIDEMVDALFTLESINLSSIVVSVECHNFPEGGPDATKEEFEEWIGSINSICLQRVSQYVREHDGQYFTSDGECFLRLFDAAKHELEIDRELKHFAAQQYADESYDELNNELEIEREEMERDYHFNSMDYV
jgi:hypothetical protein